MSWEISPSSLPYAPERVQAPTWMVFLYFVSDTEQNGPSTVTEWTIVLDKMRNKLGLPKYHLFDQRIVSVLHTISTLDHCSSIPMPDAYGTLWARMQGCQGAVTTDSKEGPSMSDFRECLLRLTVGAFVASP